MVVACMTEHTHSILDRMMYQNTAKTLPWRCRALTMLSDVYLDEAQVYKRTAGYWQKRRYLSRWNLFCSMLKRCSASLNYDWGRKKCDTVLYGIRLVSFVHTWQGRGARACPRVCFDIVLKRYCVNILVFAMIWQSPSNHSMAHDNAQACNSEFAYSYHDPINICSHLQRYEQTRLWHLICNILWIVHH